MAELGNLCANLGGSFKLIFIMAVAGYCLENEMDLMAIIVCDDWSVESTESMAGCFCFCENS